MQPKNVILKKPVLQMSMVSILMLIFTLFSGTTNAQSCTSPPSALVNGNFDTPAGAISAGNSGINNDMPGWFVSHGHPTTQTNAPRTMWMWSYRNTSNQLRGEGVYNCYDFQVGQSYLICFDLQTNGKADGATVNVDATSGFSPGTGSTAFPTGAVSEQIWQDLAAGYTYANWSTISVVYTPTVNNTQIWFYPRWDGVTPGTPAPEGNPGQAEMRIDNVSVSLINPSDTCPCDITASYSYTAGDSCSVQFNETASGNCCTNVLGYQWDFGDGTTGTGPNPNHTFPGTGTYTVCLTAVGLNADGECCTDEYCYDVYVNCDPCTCDIVPDFSFEITDCLVQFADLSAGNSCTQITGWSWDFGDGNTSSAQNPVHQYAASGTYTVCLTVSGVDASGNPCTQTICKKITVDCPSDCECFIQMDMGFDIQGCDVNFMGFADSDCDIIDWNWDFGDGNTANGQNPSHSYSSNGIYTVCLTVTLLAPDGTLCYETLCLQINITNCDRGQRVAPTQGSEAGQPGLPFEPMVYPNPSSGDVFIEFQNETEVEVEVTIYNGVMSPVETLSNESYPAGKHKLTWQADKASNAAGVYYVMIKSGHDIKLEKVVINN